MAHKYNDIIQFRKDLVDCWNYTNELLWKQNQVLARIWKEIENSGGNNNEKTKGND